MFDLTIRAVDKDGRTLMRMDSSDSSRREGGRCTVALPEGTAFLTYGPAEPINDKGIMHDMTVDGLVEAMEFYGVAVEEGKRQGRAQRS